MPYEKYIEFGVIQSIYRVIDGAWIPLDVGNMDYKEFLQYLDDNNLTIDDIPLYAP